MHLAHLNGLVLPSIVAKDPVGLGNGVLRLDIGHGGAVGSLAALYVAWIQLCFQQRFLLVGEHHHRTSSLSRSQFGKSVSCRGVTGSSSTQQAVPNLSRHSR